MFSFYINNPNNFIIGSAKFLKQSDIKKKIEIELDIKQKELDDKRNEKITSIQNNIKICIKFFVKKVLTLN